MYKSISYFFLICFLPLSVSAKEIEIGAKFLNSYCSKNFGMISFRFENNTDKWVTIKNSKVVFNDGKHDRDIRLVTGKALLSWHDSMSSKIEENRFFRSLIFGALGGIGSSMIAGGNEDPIVESITIGSLGIIALSKIDAVKTEIEARNLVPNNHIYYGDVLIPPNLFSDKWILVNTDSSDKVPFITHVTLSAETSNGDKINYSEILRSKSQTQCKWQEHLAKPSRRKL